MSIKSRLSSWIDIFTRRSGVESEQLEEWRFHIDQRTADLQREGLSATAARRQARAEFGSLDARREEARDALGLRLLDDLRADLRYAARLLRDSPAFALVAILSLALGIGANTAIFSLMESLLWKTLPVPSPGQLRQVEWVSGPNVVMSSSWGNDSPTSDGAVKGTSIPYPVFVALKSVAEREGARLVAFKPIGRLTTLIDGRAELTNVELISGSYYQSIGVVVAAGRGIEPSDDRLEADGTVAVLSHAFWARRFGLDRGAIGKTIRINQVPVTIVGVHPPDFTGFDAGNRPDVFLPITSQPAVLPMRGESSTLLDKPDFWWVLAMARIPDSIDERRLQAAFDVTLGQHVRPLLEAKPGTDRPHVGLTPGDRGVDDLRRHYTQPLLVLMAFVGLVLLIASANLANLLLARATARQREIGLRLALGAGPLRIARQLLTEGLVLAGLGGACGVLLGYWLRNGIPQLLSNSWQPPALHAEFGGRVLLLTMAVTVGTGMLFSLAPIWQSGRVRVTAALKDGARATSGRSRRASRRALVVLQVAVSVVLLVGAGLFVRTLWNLRSANLGFNPEHLVLFTVDPPRARYDGEARAALFGRIEQAVARVPGAEATTVTTQALVANGSWTTRATPAGRESRGAADRTWVNDVGVTFFETMGIPILRGRAFGAQDRPGAPHVAIVNKQFVKTFYPDKDALGQTFTNNDTVYHIVGISADARYDRVNRPMPPTFYRPYAQASHLESMTFEVRTGLETASLMRAVQTAVEGIDRDLPVFDVRSQVEQIDATLAQQRLFAALTSAFGLLALVLASIGIYGVIAGSVASRITEIGVRMAVGAESRQVLVMILREAATLAGLGVALGLAAASGLVRRLTDYLYELTPFDPVTAAAATILILAVAFLSGWWPARAASRLDPIQALRHE